MESESPNKFNIEGQQEKQAMLEMIHELEETENVEMIREKLGPVLELIEKDLGVKFSSDINGLYDNMRSENCLVRVEKLSRVMETIELGSPLKISNENESHYANAVIAEPKGIKIALSEGQAPGPTRVMVGFGKTIIGFKTDHISVSKIDFDENDIRDTNERKYLCRHVEGELLKEDIRYIVIRIPSILLDENYLTSEEKASKTSFIFRGAKLP